MPRRTSRHVLDDKKARRKKLYCIKSEERPSMPHMLKSFYSAIMDNKEVGKSLALLSNCTKDVKPDIQAYIKRWKPYHFLWKNDRTTRQLMEFTLLEFETSLKCLSDLDMNLLTEPARENFGLCIAINNEKLKYGLAIEIKGMFSILLLLVLYERLSLLFTIIFYFLNIKLSFVSLYGIIFVNYTCLLVFVYISLTLHFTRDGHCL